MVMFRRKQKTTARSPAKSSGGSPVFSYYNNRPADTSSTKQRKRDFSLISKRNRDDVIHHLHRLPMYIASFLIFGSILYATTLDNQPKVLLGSQSDTSLLRSPISYQSAIADILDNSIFSQNKLTINTESIAKQVQAAFPEIQTATVSIPLVGRRPVVGLDPATPAVIFSNKTGSYVMAADGRIMMRTTELTDINKKALKLPTIQDESDIAVEQGNQALPKEDVTFITTVLFQLRAKNITAESIKLPAIPNELHIKTIGSAYYIKFSIVGDARVQVGAYLAVQNKLKSQNTSPSEYIDVRIEDRVYYK